jgi:hypothetical protein
VESAESQELVSTSSHEPLNRHVSFPLDRANQAAAKTVRGQPCRLARPRPSGAPGGQPPGPFHAPHPLRYPLVPPFSSEQMLSEGAGPSRTYFHKPARSLCSLTRKKFWTGTPAPSPKTIPSMRKKGEAKTGTPPRSSVEYLNQRKEPYPSIPPGCRFLGSSRIGIEVPIQSHLALESISDFRLISGLENAIRCESENISLH